MAEAVMSIAKRYGVESQELRIAVENGIVFTPDEFFKLDPG
jgi:hypothetical protein